MRFNGVVTFAVFLTLLLNASFTHAFWGITNATLSMAPQTHLRLCYISLHNEQEVVEAKRFVDAIQNTLGTGPMIEVTEFQQQGANPEKTLMKIIDGGTKCDGLVISGHHTGAFGGPRAEGTLSIDFFERYTCDPARMSWFLNVNALWLQGCRTLGAPEEQNLTTEGDRAEFHAARVTAVREQDGLRQNADAMMREFAAVLDSETPYGSRFLRVFENAKVFGWTATAPGEKANSEFSLLYHVANVARRLLLEGKGAGVKLAPPTASMTKISAQAYMDALVTLLLPAKTKSQVMAAVEGWKDHGNANPAQGIYGFNNVTLNALPPLSFGTDNELMNVKQLECRVRSGAVSEKLEALDNILNDETKIALSFYTLKNIVKQSYAQPELSRALMPKLKSSEKLISFLERKINGKNVGIVNRIEYMSLYRDLTGRANAADLQKLKDEAFRRLTSPSGPNHFFDRDMKISLTRTLSENEFMTLDEHLEILKNSKDDAVPQTTVELLYTWPARFRPRAAEFIEALRAHPKANGWTKYVLLSTAAPTLGYRDFAGAFAQFFAEAQTGRLDAVPWTDLAMLMAQSVVDLPDADQNLAVIRRHIPVDPGSKEAWAYYSRWSGWRAVVQAAANPNLKLRDRSTPMNEALDVLKRAPAEMPLGDKVYPVFTALQGGKLDAPTRAKALEYLSALTPEIRASKTITQPVKDQISALLAR